MAIFAPCIANAQQPSGSQIFKISDSANESGILNFEAVGDRWLHKVVIRFDPSTAKGPLTIQCEGLIHEDEEPVELKFVLPREHVEDAKVHGSIDVPVPPLELLLVAKLPKSGSYVGGIRLNWSGGPDELHEIKINRTPQPFTTSEVATVGKGSWSLKTNYPFIEFSHTFSVGIQAPPRHQLIVTPEFFQLRKSGAIGNDKVDMDVSQVKFSEIGKTKADTKVVEIGPNAIKHIRVEMLGLLAAGKYETIIKFLTPDHIPLDRTFTLVVKRNWVWCLLMIWLGAGASLWLKFLSKTKRPKLVVRQTIANLQWQMDMVRNQYALSGTETPIFDAIQARISSWYTQAISSDPPDVNWGTNARTALVAEEAKLHLFVNWVNARRALEIADLPDAKRIEFAQMLNKIAAEIADVVAVPPGDSTSLLEAIIDLQSAKRKTLESALTQFQGQVNNTVHAIVDEKAANELKEATNASQQASAELQAGHFVNFAALFDQANLAYIHGLALDLKAKLPKEDDRATISAASLFPIDDIADKAIGQALHAVDAESARFYYEKARQALANAQAQASVAKDQAHVQGGAPLLLATNNVAQIDVPNALPPIPPLPPANMLATLPFPVTKVREDMAALSLQTRNVDRTIAILTLLVTGLLGIEFLWVPEEAWGQLNDWLKALLWGLGLGHVTKESLQGIAAVQNQITQ